MNQVCQVSSEYGAGARPRQVRNNGGYGFVQMASAGFNDVLFRELDYTRHSAVGEDL
jgi:hypothetical protein